MKSTEIEEFIKIANHEHGNMPREVKAALK